MVISSPPEECLCKKASYLISKSKTKFYSVEDIREELTELTGESAPEDLLLLLFDTKRNSKPSALKNLDKYLACCDCDYCVLLKFDRDSRLGPFIGISRAERLSRAIKFNLPVCPKQALIISKYYDYR